MTDLISMSNVLYYPTVDIAMKKIGTSNVFVNRKDNYNYCSMKRFIIILVSLFWAISFANAGTLNLQLEMKRGNVISERISAQPRRNIVYFVIDCSGSMADTYTGPIEKYNNRTTRKKVLYDLLKERWNSMPPNAEVNVYLYSLKLPKPFYESPIKDQQVSAKERDAVLNRLNGRIEKLIGLNGGTPYFDTLAHVFDSIEQNGLLRAGNVDLMVYDYTDGINFTGYEKVQFPSFKRVGNHFEDDEISAKEAEKKFLRSNYGRIKKALEEKGSYEPLWLGKQNVKGKSSNMKEIPEYVSLFTVNTKNLKNPNATATQDASGTLSFPMSEDNWKLLSGSRASLAVEIDGKTIYTKQFTIKNGSERIPLELPVLPDGKTVSLRVTCPEGKVGAFKLKSPPPVKLEFPPMEEVTLSSINVTPSGKVRKGEKVMFEAQTNGTGVTWVFNGEEASEKLKTITRVFGKEGIYAYSAVAFCDGFKPSRKLSGTIEVVDIGITVDAQSEKAYPEQAVTFTAKPRGGTITPNSYVWTCTQKDAADAYTMILPGNTASIKHTFLEPGKYWIEATALYDDLPTVTEKDKKPWTVYVRPTLKLSDDMVDGKEMSFGEPFSLVAVPTGEVDVDNIVWYADGKEIEGRRGAKIEVPSVTPSAGQGEIKVAFYAKGKAKDGSGKVLETRKVSFTFRCGHRVPTIQSYDKDGKARKDFTRGETIRFTLEPENKYTDIVWEFGDDTQKNTEAVGTVEHTYQKGDKTYDCKARCKCRECHVELAAEPAQVKIDSIPLVNRFQIRAQKSSYAPKSTITLEATGKGFSKCRFMRKIGRDGEWQECEANNGTASIPDTLPGSITDVTYKLEVWDMDGNLNDEGHQSNQITVGVRIWWLALFFIFFAAMIWYVFKIGWSGNEPRGWQARGKFALKIPRVEKFAFALFPPKKMSECWRAWQFCKVEDKKGTFNVLDVAGNAKCPDGDVTVKRGTGAYFADITMSRNWERIRQQQVVVDSNQAVYADFKPRGLRDEKITDMTLRVLVIRVKDCITFRILLFLLALLLSGITLMLCFRFAI